MVLTKEQIFAVNDLKITPLEVPEWGGSVYIRVMSGVEREAYEEWATSSGKSLKGIRGRIVALCVTDEKGDRLFSDDDVDDLNKKSAAVLEYILSSVMKLNEVSGADMEDLAKN